MFWYLFAQNTQKVNQTLKTLRPTIQSTHHDHLKTYYFLSIFPLHTAQIEGKGEQDLGGDGSQHKDGLVVGVGKGKMLEKDEEVFDWRGSSNLREEEVLGEV